MTITLYILMWWGCGLVGAYIFLMVMKHNFPKIGINGGDVSVSLLLSLIGPIFLMGVLTQILLFTLVYTLGESIHMKSLLDWLNK